MKAPLVSLTILAVFLIAGCAGNLQTPNFYFPIGKTGWNGYIYAGVGLKQDSDVSDNKTILNNIAQ